MGESRQLRSSPRLSNSSNKTSSPGKVVDSATSKDGKKKRLSSEKTRDEKSAKRAIRVKSHSTSSRPVAGSSKCSTGHSSPDNKIKEAKKTSFVENVRETHAGVRTREPQQDSSDESSGKENHDPEALATEDNVTRLRSRASRVTQVESQENAEEEPKQEVQMESPKRTCLRSAAKAGFPEHCSKREDNVESCEPDVQEEPEREIHLVSPKRAFLRSATGKNVPECHSENDVRKESRETNTQTECEQDLQMESPKTTSLKAATQLTIPERDRVKSCESNVQKQSDQDIEMESPRKSSLRSATKLNLPEKCGKSEDFVKPCGSNVQKQSEQDIEMESPKSTSRRSATKEKLSERHSQNNNTVQSRKEESEQDIHMESPKRNSLRSAVKETLQGSCVESPASNVQEQPEEDMQMKSLKRACLRSSAKGNLSERDSGESKSKNPESPPVKETNLERKRRTSSSPKTTKQHSDEPNSARVTESSKISPGDKQGTIETVQKDCVARLTRSRAHSAPAFTVKLCDDADITDKTKSVVSCSVTQESVEQEHMETRVDSGDRRISCVKCEPQKSIPSSKASALNATKTTNKHETNQSSKNFPCGSCGSEVVPEVEIKLPDCRQLCVIRRRPVLETESDESETESIQLSSGEMLSKQSSSKNASSDGKEDDISSTPTLEYYPSPVSSEKSGNSDEAPWARKYSLRKREDQEDHVPCPEKRTRSQCKTPDEDSKMGDRDESRRRKTISSPFTSVKAKRETQKSVASSKKKTPEKRPNDSGRKKRTSNNYPRGKDPNLKDPTSESDSSTFSGSPRSGPIHETRSTGASIVHSAVRNLEEEAAEEAKESFLLSDGVLSLGDISTTAVCGSPYHMSASVAGIKLLNGSPRIKKDFHSVTFLDKRRRERSGVTRLFESDDEEEEDFIGFNVPHFDGSFSSEGDLSCKINSIVESMDGEASQTTLEDEEDITVHEAGSGEEEIEIRESIEREIETATGKDTSRRGTNGELAVEKDEEIRQADDTRIGRKRKSSQIEGNEVKRRNLSESQSERRSSTESSSVVDDEEDDFDEDDDVFSTVADSSDGEEIASPLSISSWGRKRKSEDLQPLEIERPAKRRKSQKKTTMEQSDECSQSSRAETPVKRGAGQEMETQKENEKPTSFMSRIDELLDNEQRKSAQSSSSVQDSDSFYDSDVSVYQTLEERVKLRRIKNSAPKEHENSQSLPRTRVHEKHDSTELTAKGKTEGRLPALKPLRKQTFKPLKPLKHVSPIRSSLRLSRSNSTPSSNPSPLATPSGRSRRGTWIYDVNEFTSPPSAAPRFGGKPVTCSTPASIIPSSKRVLRPLKHGTMTEDSMLWKSRQQDVFVFDE